MGNSYTKKNENVFTLSFDRNDPYHQKVINILNTKGRKKAQYIVNAVMAFESGDNTDYGHIGKILEDIMSHKNADQQKTSSHAEVYEKVGLSVQSSEGVNDIIQSLDSFRI